MMDRDYLFAFDLQGRDCTVTIAKVTGGEIKGTGGKKSKKPLCYFREAKDGRPLGLTDMRRIVPLIQAAGLEPGSVPSDKAKTGELAAAPPPETDAPASTGDRQPGEDDL